MHENVRRISHDGEDYVSLNDIIELAKRCNDLTHFEIMLSDNEEEIEEYKGDLDSPKEGLNPLSDFNKKLVKGLGFNPKEDKNHFEMRDYPVIGILKDGTEVTNPMHHLINRHNLNVLKCKKHLNILKHEETKIYVDEETDLVYCYINGKKKVFK